MADKTPISSSELGTLWIAYIKNKMMSKFLDYFLILTDDEAAKNIMTTYCNNINNLANEVEQMFRNEGAVIPIAFQENDVIMDAPPLL